MRREPYINTIHMKRVRANRKCTDVVVLFKLEQTNSTVMAISIVSILLVEGFRSVDGKRYGLDDGVIESVRREDVEAIAWIEGRIIRW